MPSPAGELGMVLNLTRMIRLGLEAMWSAVDSLPDSMAPDPDVRQALVTISQWLNRVEDAELRDGLLTRNYVVIRPVSLVNPPSAQALANIRAAIAVLNGYQLVIASDD